MEATARQYGAERLIPSWRALKKWAVLYNGKWIHFGDERYEDFTQHGDEKRRESYRKRHSGIMTAGGYPAYLDRTKPAFWAWNLLW